MLRLNPYVSPIFTKPPLIKQNPHIFKPHKLHKLHTYKNTHIHKTLKEKACKGETIGLAMILSKGIGTPNWWQCFSYPNLQFEVMTLRT